MATTLGLPEGFELETPAPTKVVAGLPEGFELESSFVQPSLAPGQKQAQDVSEYLFTARGPREVLKGLENIGLPTKYIPATQVLGTLPEDEQIKAQAQKAFEESKRTGVWRNPAEASRERMSYGQIAGTQAVADIVLNPMTLLTGGTGKIATTAGESVLKRILRGGVESGKVVVPAMGVAGGIQGYGEEGTPTGAAVGAGKMAALGTLASLGMGAAGALRRPLLKEELKPEKIAETLSKAETDAVFKTNNYGAEMDPATGAYKPRPEYQEQVETSGKIKPFFTEPQLLESIYAGVNDHLVPIQTRFEAVDESLANRMWKNEKETLQAQSKDLTTIGPFIRAMRKVPEKSDDMVKLASSWSKGDLEGVRSVVDRHNRTFTGAAPKERLDWKQLRGYLDNKHTELTDAGFDFGFIKNYLPRSVADYEGFLSHASKGKIGGEFQKELAEKEAKLGHALTDVERNALMDKHLFKMEHGVGSSQGFMKSRAVDDVPPDFLQFYDHPADALAGYAQRANEAIGHNKLRGYANGSLEDSINSIMLKLIAEGKVTSKNEAEVKTLLDARFASNKMNRFVSTIRELTYLDTLKDFTNGITQVGDALISVMMNDLRDSAPAMRDLIMKKGLATFKKDVGIDDIAHEFTNTGKLKKIITSVFKSNGLSAFDAMGKNLIMTTELHKLSRQALENDPKMLGSINQLFGSRADQVLADLKAGRKTEDTNLLAFMGLAKMQPPSTKLGYPLKYHLHPNGRIFYTLKSWTIGQLDFMRRQWRGEMQQGTNPENVAKATAKTLYTVGALAAAGATTNTIKDYILGRPFDVGDNAMNGLLGLMGLSQYQMNQVDQKGIVGTASSVLINATLPPSIDNLWRDVKSGNFPDRSLRSIPLFGNEIYYWYGEGLPRYEKSKQK